MLFVGYELFIYNHIVHKVQKNKERWKKKAQKLTKLYTLLTVVQHKWHITLFIESITVIVYISN